VEATTNALFSGTITLDNVVLTLCGSDGSVENFRVQTAGRNRMNFFDARTGQPIQRFHWVRS